VRFGRLAMMGGAESWSSQKSVAGHVRHGALKARTLLSDCSEHLYHRKRTMLRREMELLALPPHWVAEGADGFQPESVFDIAFGPVPRTRSCRVVLGS